MTGSSATLLRPDPRSRGRIRLHGISCPCEDKTEATREPQPSECEVSTSDAACQVAGVVPAHRTDLESGVRHALPGRREPFPTDALRDLRKLWKTYGRTRRSDLRNALLGHYYHLVQSETRRIALRLPRHIDERDLHTAAVLGLIDAIAHFEPDRQVGFEAYGRARVRGAILDELRRTDWIPRTWRSRKTLKANAETRLRDQLGREPFDEEMAEALRVSLEEYRSLFLVSRAAVQAPTGMADGERNELFEVMVDPRSEEDQNQMLHREMIGQLLEELSEKEREVMTLKYFNGWTMRQIGGRLCLSESRVCRIHTAVLERMKRRLEPHIQDLLA